MKQMPHSRSSFQIELLTPSHEGTPETKHLTEQFKQPTHITNNYCCSFYHSPPVQAEEINNKMAKCAGQQKTV